MAAAAGRARLRRVVARVAGRLPLLRTGHSIELLEGGQAYFPALERAIDAAQTPTCGDPFVTTCVFGARRASSCKDKWAPKHGPS